MSRRPSPAAALSVASRPSPLAFQAVSRLARGAFLAAGARGQYIYVHPTEQVVVAIQSAWRHHDDTDAEAEMAALLGAAVRALRPDPAS